MTQRLPQVLERLAAALPLGRPPWMESFGTTDFPQAAVLVALTRESSPRVLLGRRAQHLPQHPGEIAFAGGKRERDDASPWATACREAYEEVGIASDAVVAIGELDLLITRTGFHVHPCVAVISADPVLVVDTREFDSVFLPELSVFAQRSRFELRAMSDGVRTRMVPHYQLESDNVWGVTAAILAQLANIAYDAGLDLQRDWRQRP